MAKTLTIAGADFMPQIVTNSAMIREQLQNKSNVFNFLVVKSGAQTVPKEGSEIVYKDGARFLFGGFITRVEPVEQGEGDFFSYRVEASDYGWIFNNKVARKAYTNSTLKTIVEDLLSTYVATAYSFTTTNVQTGPTITSITFDHVSIRKCFEKLSKLSGFVWYVDYEKNLFFQSKQQTAAAEDITDDTNNFEEIALNFDASQVRNSVIVIGSADGQQSDNTNVETFTGDGDTMAWRLEDKPSNVLTIKFDGVSKPFSLDLNEKDDDWFVYSFNDKSFRLTEGRTPPTGGQTVEIEYNPRVPVIVQRQDAASIALIAALDGGDGIYELTVKEKSITTKAEAIDRAEEELEEFASPLLNAVFKTRTSLLSSGPDTVFAPGQFITVNLPTWGISSDTVYLIQEVVITMIEDEAGTDTEYLYSVRFGGKIVDIQRFLESLASESDEVSDVDEIKTIFGTSDQMELADAAPTKANYTPPFQWGPAGNPQFVFNLAEWA